MGNVKLKDVDYWDASVIKRNRSSANNYNFEIHTILWEIIIYTLISGFSRENRKLSGKFTFPRGFETLFGPISSRA